MFFEAGVDDILYAVGIAPAKLPRVLALRARGCDLAVILDSHEQAEAVAEAAREAGDAIPVLIEIDSDGLRSGLDPADPELPVGTRLRILPNHACATAAQFDGYEVLPANGSGELAHWSRFRGW